jgi:hypothetical protein
MPLKTKGRIWRLLGVLSAVAMLGTALVATAEADPPPPLGGSLFPELHGPADPEDYSWTVSLGPGQALEQVDDQEAVVEYNDGTVAFRLHALPAHDAVGTSVPTTIATSKGDVVTETVHHRAGNPATGGTPFVYPIIGGAGWEGGLTTTIIDFFNKPPGATQPEPTVTHCRVPKLMGRNLRSSETALRTGNCTLGRVHHRGVGGSRKTVVRQGAQPGTELPSGSRIWVIVGSA